MGRKDQFKSNKNPATIVLEWAGASDAGFFKYYDKVEKTKNNKAFPIKFAVLAERNSMSGWIEERRTNGFTNEVLSLRDEELVVRCFDNGHAKELFAGLYADIKGQAISLGLKYNKVVYAVVLSCDTIEAGTIVRLLMKGASASAWFDVNGKDAAILVNDSVQGQKGAVRFLKPAFSVVPMSAEEDEMAETAYDVVNGYLTRKALSGNAPSLPDKPDYSPLMDDKPPVPAAAPADLGADGTPDEESMPF